MCVCVCVCVSEREREREREREGEREREREGWVAGVLMAPNNNFIDEVILNVLRCQLTY